MGKERSRRENLAGQWDAEEHEGTGWCWDDDLLERVCGWLCDTCPLIAKSPVTSKPMYLFSAVSYLGKMIS